MELVATTGAGSGEGGAAGGPRPSQLTSETDTLPSLRENDADTLPSDDNVFESPSSTLETQAQVATVSMATGFMAHVCARTVVRVAIESRAVLNGFRSKLLTEKAAQSTANQRAPLLPHPMRTRRPVSQETPARRQSGCLATVTNQSALPVMEMVRSSQVNM